MYAVELPALAVAEPPTKVSKLLAVVVNTALRDKVPLNVSALCNETAFEIVRLLSAVTLEGITVPAKELPIVRLEEEVVVRLVAVPAMAAPFSVSVLLPTLNAPFVNVRVPLKARFPSSETPLLLLIVRLVNEVKFDGIVILEDDPPNERLEVASNTSLVGVPAIAGPLSVIVAPVPDSVPEVSVSVPFTVRLVPVRVTASPPVLLIVRLLTIVGKVEPVF